MVEKILKFLILFLIALIAVSIIGLFCTAIGESMLSIVHTSENAKSFIEIFMLLLPGPIDAFGMVKNSFYSLMITLGVKTRFNI